MSIDTAFSQRGNPLLAHQNRLYCLNKRYQINFDRSLLTCFIIIVKDVLKVKLNNLKKKKIKDFY